MGNIWLNVLTYHPVNIAVKIFVSITQRHETDFFQPKLVEAEFPQKYHLHFRAMNKNLVD